MSTPPTTSRIQRHHRAGFLAGLIAGALLTAVMFVASRGFEQYSFPELVAYRLIALLPLSLFSLGVETFGGNAKQLMLLGTAVGQVVICGLLGVLWASCASSEGEAVSRSRRAPALWNADLAGGLFFALILFILAELFLFPLVGQGVFGVRLPAGLGISAAVLALEAILFGGALAMLYRALSDPAPLSTSAGEPLTRRQLLTRVVFGIAALAIGGGGVVVFGRTPAAATVSGKRGRVGNGGLPPEVTANDDFYSVSKNFVDPIVSEQGWKVQIGGLVERPYSLSLAEIKGLPSVTEYRTLNCISNEIGGDLISNASWKGVRLKDLLETAGVKPGAVDLVLRARDGYTDSFPIAKALTPEVLAVYEMNGEQLPDKHGFPLRLLVPDIYGMKNVKWITNIDVVGSDYQGFWQQQGWSDVATVQTMSRIDFPRSRDLIPTGRTSLGGVAFAGGRGVARVEVSADAGKTWSQAKLRRPLGFATWVLWTAELHLGEGDHSLKVRATDGIGKTQTSDLAPTLPDGATGWHTVLVRAAPGVPAPSPVDDPTGDQPLYQPQNSGTYSP